MQPHENSLLLAIVFSKKGKNGGNQQGIGWLSVLFLPKNEAAVSRGYRDFDSRGVEGHSDSPDLLRCRRPEHWLHWLHMREGAFVLAAARVTAIILGPRAL